MLEKVEKFFAKVMGGTSTERALKRIEPVVDSVKQIAEGYKSLSDDELRAKTHEFKYRLNSGETLDDILPEAYAAVVETCHRLLGRKWMVRGQETEWNMVPYDVQILGGVVLHEGKIAEMATGEGKTLVATMPLYLNALEGRGAHLVTVNDYLAQRDCEWMGKIYQFLGLTVSAIHGDQSPEERKKAYTADITYGTNNEFGFDYLRDNMAADMWSVVQRGLHFAIVDEVDSVLIDEARTPLIISGAVGAPRNVYYEIKPIVSNLYRKQRELVDQLVREGKSALERDEEAAGLLLLRAHRGDPKNQVLLDLLTSEFWVKKLIERIQGQYEINKTMGDVDAELYYTIDEKSHIVDITEKGRIFLSGGREKDIVEKISMLDALDEHLAALGEKKAGRLYFSQDPVSGTCNGFTALGKVVLAGGRDNDPAEVMATAENLSQQLAKLVEKIDQSLTQKKGDRRSEWQRYFVLEKQTDWAAVGLTEEGRSFLSDGDLSEPLIAAFNELLSRTAASDGATRDDAESHRHLKNLCFSLERQYSLPTGLTDAGVIALAILIQEGDPMLLPSIDKLDSLLRQTHLAEVQEYVELSDDGSVVKHFTEKGRIYLLGGNPDLYVLPDRTLVEERDRQIQQLLDRTLNQSSYDYVARVLALNRLERDLAELFVLSSESDETFLIRDQNNNLLKWSEQGRALLTDYAETTQRMVQQLDTDLRENPELVLRRNEAGEFISLSDEERDRLLGSSFAEMERQIRAWNREQEGGGEDTLAKRLDLDQYLRETTAGTNGEALESLSRRYEEVVRIDLFFQNLTRGDLAAAERERLKRRYFDGAFKGLSEAGARHLMGPSLERRELAERLMTLMADPDVELEALFELDGGGAPVRLQPASRPQLLDGLVYFDYANELGAFRDEIHHLASKKAKSRSELESLVGREKAQLRGRGFLLDEREMNELLSKTHAPHYVLTAEEIEHWFRLHFERKPRAALEGQRDKLWEEYTRVEERVQNISQLLRAFTLYQKDVDYVVKAVEEGEMRRAGGAKGQKAVMIVDQFTGRLMPGRRFSDGLHEALEAKEGVEVQAESQTLATITLQNFFRLYDKLAGMTGTAETEAQEFFSTYELDVVVAPTNRPVIRQDQNDVIFRTKREKYNAIIEEAISMHEAGRPVLVGTISVDVSQRLSDMFTQRGIPLANWLKKGDVSRELESGRFHTVLNAKFHHKEAEIVSKAGLAGTITIATNMAGRGTDIKLPPEVVERGGLHIIGSEKHEARRIDRQLRGRSGRQGDPGSSRFYLSLEDDLMRLFGSDRITSIMSRLGPMEEGERIEHPLVTRSIERAQKKVEERNFDIRKNLLEYDNVLNEQRKIIYKRRQNLLGFAQAEDFVESKAKRYFSEEDERTEWRLDELIENLRRFFDVTPDFDAESLYAMRPADIKSTLVDYVGERLDEEAHLHQLQERHRILGYCPMEAIIEHLIRTKVLLHGAGASDPKRWNLEGLIYELERLFSRIPDWLTDSSRSGDADTIRDQLIEWAQACYREAVEEHRAAYDRITFSELAAADLIHLFVAGSMDRHLPEEAPPVTWTTEDFLADLERIFEGRPALGANEMRTIRREKIAAIVTDWISALQGPDDSAIRHRILGYFTSRNLVSTLVRAALTETDARWPMLVRKLLGEQVAEKLASDNRAALLNAAREVYLSLYRELREPYDRVMLSSASMEEMIEASILALIDRMFSRDPDLDKRQGRLSQTLESVYLSRPQIKAPDGKDENALSLFRKNLVTWALDLYRSHSERLERLRQERLSGEIVRDSVLMMIDDTIYTVIKNALGEGADLDADQVRRLEAECRLIFRQSPRISDESDEAMDPNAVMDRLSRWARDLYQHRVAEIGEHLVARYERYYILEKIDQNWRHHLSGVDELREGIGLRGYGQKDPLLEYKSEAYNMFVRLIDSTNRDVTSTLFRVFDVGGEIEQRQLARFEPKQVSATHSQVETFKSSDAKEKPAPSAPAKRKPVVKGARVGRNAPCPCGSGKKYKHCCGKNS